MENFGMSNAEALRRQQKLTVLFALVMHGRYIRMLKSQQMAG